MMLIFTKFVLPETGLFPDSLPIPDKQYSRIMSFSCIFRLNNGAIKDSDEVIFLEYVDESFGKHHTDPVKIGKVIFNNAPAFIYSNSPGFFSSKGTLKSGDKLDSQTKIGYFHAEGEDIPYSRPYATIRIE
jgi:hypothetical protein